MSIESFSPSSPEYKEVKDLPQEEQENFVDVEVEKRNIEQQVAERRQAESVQAEVLLKEIEGGGRLNEKEALLYQQYATDIEGKSFNKQASPEAYREAEKLLRQFQDSKFDWLDIDWDKIDFKDLRDITNVEGRVRLAAQFILQEAREKDPSLFEKLVGRLGGVSKATDILEGTAGTASVATFVASLFAAGASNPYSLGGLAATLGFGVSLGAMAIVSNPDFRNDLKNFIKEHI